MVEKVITEEKLRDISAKKNVPYEDLAAEAQNRGYRIQPAGPAASVTAPREPSASAVLGAITPTASEAPFTERQMRQSVVVKQLEKERDSLVEAEAAEKIRNSTGVMKFAYSIGLPPTVGYAATHPIASTLAGAFSPFTAMSRGISTLIATSIPISEDEINQEIQSLKNNPTSNVAHMLNEKRPKEIQERILRGVAITNIQRSRASKAMLGETSGATEAAGALGRSGAPIGVATAAAALLSATEDAPYWLTLPPYTKAFGAVINTAGAATKPIVKGAMQLAQKYPGIENAIQKGQIAYKRAAEYPLEEGVAKLTGKIGNYDLGTIAGTQSKPLDTMVRQRIATNLDAKIASERADIGREYMRALRAGDYDVADYMIREMDMVGAIPDDLLAREAVKEGTIPGMVSEVSVKNASKEIRTGPVLRGSTGQVEQKPRIEVPDVSMSETEALLVRKQIDNLNAVIPTVGGKAKQALIRRRSVLENRVENARMDIFQEAYIPEESAKDPILKQAREDLFKSNTQFNLFRGAKPQSDVLYGFAEREFTGAEEANILKVSAERLDPNGEAFVEKLTKEVIEQFRSPYYKMPDAVWRPMKWAEESERNLIVAGHSSFESAVGTKINEFAEGGAMAESGKKLFKVAEYMRGKGMDRTITPSLIKQFNLNDMEIKAFNAFQDGYKYIREMINTQYPGTLPKQLDEIAYVTRLMPTKQYVAMLETEKIKLEETLTSFGKDSLEDRANMGKQLKQIDKILFQYRQGKPISFRMLPKTVKANFLEQRILPEALVEMNAADNYMYYMNVAGRKLYAEPTLKHLNRVLPTIEDAGTRKYTAQIAKKWAGIDYTDNALTNLSKGMVAANNFFFLTSPHQFFMNLAQISNTVIDVGPMYTSRAALHTAAESPKFMEYWQRSLYRNDVDGIIKDFSGKVGRNQTEGMVYPIQLAEPGLRKSAGFAGFLQAENEYYAKLNTPASKFVQEKVALGFRAKDACAAWGDRALERNQFIYGVLGLSKAQQSSLGKVAFLYTSYSTKELELLNIWARNNPQKLLGYLMLTYGVKSFVQNVGVDMANYIGTGINERRVWDGIKDLGKPVTDRAMANYFNYALKDSGTQQIYDGMVKVMTEGAGLLPGRIWGGTGVFQNLKTYQKMMPVGIDRLLTSTKALSEGKKEYPLIHITDETRKQMMNLTDREVISFMKEGYPFRNIKQYHLAMKLDLDELSKKMPKEEITKIYDSKELLIRNFIGTPLYDSELKRERTLDSTIQAAQKEAREQMVRAAYAGSMKNMTTWLIKYEGLGGDAMPIIEDCYYKGLVPKETYNWVKKNSQQKKKEELKMMKEKIRTLEDQVNQSEGLE